MEPMPAPKWPSITSSLLLVALFDAANESAWLEFDRRYRRILHGFSRRLGLNANDSADIAQETLVTFFQEYQAGAYDRRRGRLRSWLIGLVKRHIAAFRRKQAGRKTQPLPDVISKLPDDSLEELWEKERKTQLLQQALAELRESTRTSKKTLRAFELYVLRERDAQEVARELGMTLRDVYMAKNRVAERLREILRRLDGLFDDG